MARIPSKQLHRAGSLEELQAKLSEREVGINTTDKIAYFKLGGELYPVGGKIDIPLPTATSVLMGDAEANYGWETAEAATAPYDEEIELWHTLAGIGFAAEYATRDSEGHLIQSSVYTSYSSNGRPNPPVYGAVNIEKKMGTGFVAVRMGSGSDLGGLVPATPPTADGEFAPGDVLIAKTSAKPPFLEWVHPESTPQSGSKNPTTSGAVYNVRYLIDPNLYNPNTGEDLEITGTNLKYEKGLYYIFDSTLFECYSASSTYAEFSRVDGLVTVVNDVVSKLKVLPYYYALDSNVCRDTDGYSVNGTDILNAVSDGFIPILLLYSTRGGSVLGTAYLSEVASGSIVFRTPSKDDGRYSQYTASVYSNTWTASDGTFNKVFVAVYGETTAEAFAAAVGKGQQIFLKGLQSVDTLQLSMPLVNFDVSSNSYYFSTPPILTSASTATFYYALFANGAWTNDSKTIACS